jgi:hypothetical protein
MAETTETYQSEFEYRRAVNSVWLLRDMHQSTDPILRRQLFEQACDQETSYISEVLEGAGHTRFEFESREGRLYVLQPDGVTDWIVMHQNGVERAQRMADMKPELGFYARISKAELAEAQLQEEMIVMGLPKTIISLSLCGEDLASPDNLQAIGRDSQLRRAYLRTSVFDGEKLHIDSRTIDRLGINEAKRIYEDILGVGLPGDANSLDILESPAVFPGIRTDLADRISPPPSENTYDFVFRHKDLLDAHMEALSALALDCQKSGLDDITDNLRYDIMSAFKHRLEGSWAETGSLAGSVAYAGSIERAAGTQYIGCETVIAGAPPPGLEASGYVNAIAQEFWIWRDGACRIPNCPSKVIKDKKQKPKIGPCDICEFCQPLFDSGMNKDNIEAMYRRRPKSKDSKPKAPGFFEAIAAELSRYGQEKNEQTKS